MLSFLIQSKWIGGILGAAGAAFRISDLAHEAPALSRFLSHGSALPMFHPRPEMGIGDCEFVEDFFVGHSKHDCPFRNTSPSKP